MKIRTLILLASLAILAVLGTAAFAQSENAAAAIESIRLNPDGGILDSVVIVANPERIAYSVSGSREGGMKSLEILSYNSSISLKNCNKERACKLSGSVPSEKLQESSILTVQATAENGETRKERIKIELDGQSDKVYMIVSLPALLKSGAIDLVGGAVPAVEVQPVQGKTPATESSESNPVKREGPRISLQIMEREGGKIELAASAYDPAGVDFIEILNDDVFVDVRMCKGEPACIFKKTIELPQGEHNIKIKSMNKTNLLSETEKSLVVP